jgi:hypothetical protein
MTLAEAMKTTALPLSGLHLCPDCSHVSPGGRYCGKCGNQAGLLNLATALNRPTLEEPQGVAA